MLMGFPSVFGWGYPIDLVEEFGEMFGIPEAYSVRHFGHRTNVVLQQLCRLFKSHHANITPR